MIHWELFTVFAKIGAVTFGGGYAMISLIEGEITSRGWIPASEFADIVAISQMTPGPLALNVATYVGRQLAGIPGALVASFGLIFPAMIIVPLVIWIGKKTGSRPAVKAGIRGIRAAALGLIAAAALFFIENSIITGLPAGPVWRGSGGPVMVSWAALGVFLAALLAIGRWRVKPIPLIVFAALAGVLLGLPGFL